MDEFVIKFLKNNDLGAYEATFEAQRISQRSLTLVNEKCAEELIPIMGDRLIFLDALESLKSAKKSTHESIEASSSTNTDSRDGNSSRVSPTMTLDDLYHYKGDVYSPQECKDSLYDFNHAAIIVGYEKGHWIIRNSMGVKWGADGHLLMKFDKCGAGNVNYVIPAWTSNFPAKH